MNKKLLLLLVVSGAQISEVKPGLFDWVSKNPAKATVYGIGVAGVAVAATYYGYAPFQKLVDDAAKATGEGLKAGVETVANSWQTTPQATKVIGGLAIGSFSAACTGLTFFCSSVLKKCNALETSQEKLRLELARQEELRLQLARCMVLNDVKLKNCVFSVRDCQYRVSQLEQAELLKTLKLESMHCFKADSAIS